MSAVLRYLGAMAPYALLTVPFWLVIRTLWLAHKEQTPRPGRELILALFALYGIALASQTVLPLPDLREGLAPLLERARTRVGHRWGINLIPLKTIRDFWQRGSFEQNLINLAGNVAIFIPLGLLPPILWKRWRSGWKTAVLCLLCSLFIESLQLFIGRSVDVDDLILNTLGGLLGYGLFALGRAIRVGASPGRERN